MKKTNILFISIIFILSFITFVCGQNTNNSSNVNVQNSHSILKQNFVDIDTLSYLKINNLIYYKTPIEIYKGNLVNINYIPEWYEAYLVGQNLEKDTKVILKYLHKSCGVKTEDEVKTIMNDSNNIRLLKNLNIEAPFQYILGEIWLTNKKADQELVLVLSKYSAIKLDDYKLKPPIEKNLRDEKLDSLKFASYGIFVYIKEDGILKFPDQPYMFNLLENGDDCILNLTLQGFKDILYRSASYKLSNIDDNKKRKFETWERNGKEHIVKSIDDKP